MNFSTSRLNTYSGPAASGFLVYWSANKTSNSVKMTKLLTNHPRIDVSYETESFLSLPQVLMPIGNINSIESLILSTKTTMTKQQEKIQLDKLKILFKEKSHKKALKKKTKADFSGSEKEYNLVELAEYEDGTRKKSPDSIIKLTKNKMNPPKYNNYMYGVMFLLFVVAIIFVYFKYSKKIKELQNLTNKVKEQYYNFRK